MSTFFPTPITHSILDAQFADGDLLALVATAPTATAAGTEITGAGYLRAAITWAAAGASVARTKRPNANVLFPTPGGDWNGGATIPYWEIYDSTGAVRKAFGSFNTPISVLNGSPQPYLAPANMSLTLD